MCAFEHKSVCQLARISKPRLNLPFRKRPRVSLWLATHCNNASALQTRLLAAAVSWLGLSKG